MDELKLTTRQMVYYNSKKKSMVVAYLLGFIFGSFGAHAFYVGSSVGVVLGATTFGFLYYSFIYPDLLLIPYILFVLSGVVYTYFIVESRNKELMKKAVSLIDSEEL